MTKAIILHDFSPEQLAQLFEGLQNQLTELKVNFQPKTPTEYLTREETSKLLKCDLSTLWNWQQKKKLIPVGIGNRVLYKRSDIEEALIYLGKKKGVDNE